MNKAKNKCSQCEESFTITWDNEDLEPISCPFCGASMDNFEEEEITDDEDSWD